MSKLYLTYYTIIAVFTAVLAGHTIFLGSTHVAAGHKINNLQTQKTQQDKQILAIKKELGTQIASQTVKETALTMGFQEIDHVDQLDLSQVASAR